MKEIIFLVFLIFSINCELTRHSGDVLQRKRIFIEGHRGVSDGQKNHNTKESILNAIENGVESFETDAWLTKDKKVVLFHDLDHKIYSCKNKLYEDYINKVSQYCDLTFAQLQECETIIGNNKIPLLEDIIKVTKGKIFMNLELKGNDFELWYYIRELIEKYEYYDQISISAFNDDFYDMIIKYNDDYKRNIVFGFLKWSSLLFKYKENHQISLFDYYLTKDIVAKAHNSGMTVGVWFYNEPKDRDYYDIFEMGVDVIITDYPLRVANQLNEFYSDTISYEGCNTFEKIYDNITNCTSCKEGYQLIKMKENRNLCKLNYELDPDLYTVDLSGLYHDKDIVAIKMLMTPFGESGICQINKKTIFYFEWRFDLYDNDGKKYVISNLYGYGKLTEKQIKKLDFSKIEIYVDNKLINQEDFLCKDLYDITYYSIFRVMAAHCYFIYKGESQDSYEVVFKLFDNNYLSFVTYDNKYLSNEDSWGKSDSKKFDSSSISDTICNNIKDPFEERISCINKINNCMYCENENTCQKCNDGFSLFNGKCESSANFENNLKYFTPDNGTSYDTCSSIITNCEECSYNDYSLNKFHCTKCSKGLRLSVTYECIEESVDTLTRHSGDVLQRKRIFIEGHRGVSDGQKNHNTKESILNAIENGVESFETDAWLTKDKKVVLFHDLDKKIYSCKNKAYEGHINITSQYCDLTYAQLLECETIIGNNKIPLLEDIIKVTKGKIFMNLELKGSDPEIWKYVQDLIEKYEYYNQLSISSFNHHYYNDVVKYNDDYKRNIVFGFLKWTSIFINYQKNHQISLHSFFISKELVEKAHNKGMTVAAWFWPGDPDYYYDLFEMGVDVIITDYPLKVENQLKEFKSDKIYLEGCETIEKNIDNIASCSSCKSGYELIKIPEQEKRLCKIKYELDPDFFYIDLFGIYHRKNIYSIKLYKSPFGDYAICQKNKKNIFYFEWKFDLYDYDGTNYKINSKLNYDHLTENNIKKLDFSNIEIFIDDNLINSKDIICKDLYEVDSKNNGEIGIHCYFIYNLEKKESYTVELKIFDDDDLSFITYDSKCLINKDSKIQSGKITFNSSSISDTVCNNIKDPFEERISCINKINNCMYCENEKTCQKCNDGFILFNKKCESSANFENNLKYFSPDNGTSYDTCSSIISDCEECSYNSLSFNNFHCSKCGNGLILNESYECVEDKSKKSYAPIVITSNYDRKVKSGNKIEFKIKEIQQNKYKLNNNEIIFENAEKTSVLYFKSCQKNQVNGYITSITCEVSKNIIKGEYTIIFEGQNISIQPGNSIKFTVGDSIGGMFMKGVSAVYDSIIIGSKFRFYFGIYYFDPFLAYGDLFPYPIFLLGNKRISTRLRNLEEVYDYNITLPNCTVVSYLDEDKSAIGNISCNVPNYIPAGNYSKLQSDGFDINPNNNLNIVFMNDYNASKFEENNENVPIKRESSSSSKAWIICLCVVIAILIIAGIITTIYILRRKRNNKSTNEVDLSNNKGMGDISSNAITQVNIKQ